VVTGRDAATVAVNAGTRKEILGGASQLPPVFIRNVETSDLVSPELCGIGTIHPSQTDYQEFSE